MEFTPFPKVPRLMRTISISEKIDGTNASIWIGEVFCPTIQPNPEVIAHWKEEDITLGMKAGSRKRWIYPGKNTDNAGFAAWVEAYVDDLKKLGPGHHFGEWWGKGIQRNYGLDEKRFSLFNPKWLNVGDTVDDPVMPDCVNVVPQLWIGEFDCEPIRDCLSHLLLTGSVAAPGFMKPEGIVVYHHAANQLFKYTLGGDGHKGV